MTSKEILQLRKACEDLRAAGKETDKRLEQHLVRHYETRDEREANARRSYLMFLLTVAACWSLIAMWLVGA